MLAEYQCLAGSGVPCRGTGHGTQLNGFDKFRISLESVCGTMVKYDSNANTVIERCVHLP